MSLWSALLDALYPPRPTERLVRDARSEDVRALIVPLMAGTAAEPVAALMPYRHPLAAALIREAKYHANEKAWAHLGEALAEYLTEFVAEEEAFAPSDFALVPVPLSRERHRERTYNQAERIVASALTALSITGAPHSNALTRVRDTVSQTSLKRHERRANVRDAFSAGAISTELTYVVIDDVVTTGATLSEAARALREAGAARVISLALAYSQTDADV